MVEKSQFLSDAEKIKEVFTELEFRNLVVRHKICYSKPNFGVYCGV